MTERHCHFCRIEDVAELSNGYIALFLCAYHADCVKTILNIAVTEGVLKENRFGVGVLK